MNPYSELPPNWERTMAHSNNNYMQKIIEKHPMMIFFPHRRCMDTTNKCPAKRMGGCIMRHCILRYPPEEDLTNFL